MDETLLVDNLGLSDEVGTDAGTGCCFADTHICFISCSPLALSWLLHGRVTCAVCLTHPAAASAAAGCNCLCCRLFVR